MSDTGERVTEMTEQRGSIETLADGIATLRNSEHTSTGSLSSDEPQPFGEEITEGAVPVGTSVRT